MLGANDIRLVELCLEIRYLQNLFGLFGKGDVANRQGSAGCPDSIFNRLLQFVKIDPEIPKDLHSYSFTFPDDAKEEVLRAYVIVAQPEGFLAAKPDNILNPIGEITFHEESRSVN